MKPISLIAALMAASALPAHAENAIPADAISDCTLSQAEFDSWFVSGSAAENGATSLPDSYLHDFNVPCDFYKWGAQMFLHLTSPTGSAAEEIVVNGPGFLTAVDDGLDSQGFTAFRLERNASGQPAQFALRTRKSPDAGQAGGSETLISQGHDLVYYGIHVNDLYAAFADAEAKYPDLFKFDHTAPAPYASSIDNFPLTFAQAAEVAVYGILSGLIQTNDAELAQVRKIVTGAMGLAEDAGLDDIAADAAGFATAAEAVHKKLADSGFIMPPTIELKTSWIVADTAVPGSYVQIEAMVPTFKTRTDSQWTLNVDASGETVLTQKTLVLVGMHIVAPVKDNPEMAWMSFEHLSNNPLADYVYSTASGNRTVAHDGAGKWNFAPDTSSQPVEVAANAQVDSKTGNLVTANGAARIAPVTVALMNPWGLQNATTNPVPGKDALENINDLIALNASILGLMPAGDARARYFQIGGLWTHGGGMPAGGDPDVQVGGLFLANSTMESFHQSGAQGGGGPQNCFSCHGVSAPATTAGTGISHAFDGIVYRIQNPED